MSEPYARCVQGDEFLTRAFCGRPGSHRAAGRMAALHILFTLGYEIYLQRLSNLIEMCTREGHRVSVARNEVKRFPTGPVPFGPYRLPALPDIVVSNQSWWEKDAAVSAIALASGIPVLTIEHGSPIVYQQFGSYRRNINASLSAQWGDHGKELMIRYGCPEDKLLVAGSPAHDDLLSPRTKRPSRRPIVLFLSTHRLDIADMENAYKRTEAWCRKLGYHLWLSRHPVEKHHGTRHLRSLGCGREVHGSEYDLVHDADFIVTGLSSMLIPIYHFKKPFCCYNPLRRETEEVYSKFRISTDVRGLLSGALEVDAELYEQNRIALGHFPDGRNTRRCYDALISLANRSWPSSWPRASRLDSPERISAR